ncbi:sulfotransferase domain-containing protein [Coraliomargarita parva]|uniref:sulfotransferase domain-containing protein n=1 Tax=Coraliomargarita parva TaxID=3014050 RepID=UPI0022B50AF3|nr:sulfotransferase domain-containing protein [Coraliomargarita parva]
MDRSKFKRKEKTIYSRIITAKLKRKMRGPFARMTASRRQLPGYIVVGTHKGGTSSIQSYLIQHPQLFGGTHKELHFFDYQYHRGLDWYRSIFPRAKNLPEGSLTGEATPLYMVHPLVPARIAECIPDVKLIFLLRDPVQRSISHYYHQVRRGREKLSIADGFAAEDERVLPEKKRLLAGEIFKPEGFRRFSYRERSHYAEQLERWFQYFPREQCFIDTSERFYADTAGFLRDVFEFLGVDPDATIPDLKPRNVGIPRDEDSEIRQMLSEYFKPHNQRLEKLLGRSFDWQ